jgi:methylmalonyl-CoA mutase N-terminal domain/subunit
VVGLNAFTSDEPADIERLRVDPHIEQQACQRLQALRARRDSDRVATLRARLEAAAAGRENLMPLFVECVENHVTVGEICHSLRGIWGEYRPT